MNGNEPRIGEDMLVAYADGELDEVNRRRVERALADDPALAARLAAHRRVAAMLSAQFAPLAEEPAPDRFRALLDDATRVVPIAPARKRPQWVPYALAASLALGLLVGRGLHPGASDASVAVRDGQMIAQGDLADALNRQLASAQPADAATRIGLSFRAKSGQWCRSFTGDALSGVACRAGDEWRLEQAMPGVAREAGYRQAASGDPRMMAAIEQLIADGAVDGAGEKNARDAGWK